MRRFRDERGAVWDVVVSRESWGTLYALLVPAAAGDAGPMRRTLLQSAGYEQAQQELAGMDEASLRALFAASESYNNS